jgi:enoyl-CoA hydratase/carnithine racemase
MIDDGRDAGVFRVDMLSSALDAGLAWDAVLAAAIAEAVASPGIRAIVLEARFRNLDREVIQRLGAAGPRQDTLSQRMESRAMRLAWLVRESPLPVVFAFEGAAQGEGCILALVADGLVAAPGAVLIHPFRQTGVGEAGGLAGRLVRALGVARAMEFMVLGQPLPVETALDWGCDLQIVEAKFLTARASQLALELSCRPPNVKAKRALLRSSMPREFGFA